MAALSIWPAVGALVPVPEPDSPSLPTTGATVEDTAYIRDLLRSGLVLTYDPLEISTDPTADYSANTYGYVSATVFGALPDGITNNTAVLQQAIDNAAIGVEFRDGEFATRKLTLESDTELRGIGLLSSAQPDEEVVRANDDGSSRVARVNIFGLRVRNSATHTNDDWSAVKIKGAELCKIVGTIFDTTYVALGSDYGSDTLGPYSGNPASEDQPKRQSRDVLVAHCDAQNTAYMAYEFFASLRHRVVGNSVARETGYSTSHGYRFTGFPGMPCKHNSAVANIAHRTGTGVSVQTAAYANSLIGFVLADIDGPALQHTPNSSYATGFNRCNKIQAVADGCTYGADLYNPSYSNFDLVVKDASSDGVYLRSDGGYYGAAKGNILDLVAVDCGGASGVGARIQTSHGVHRLNIERPGTHGARIEGDYNIVDVVVDNASEDGSGQSLVVTGDYNIVRVVGTNNSTTIDVAITGDNNVVDVMTPSNTLSVSGSNNRLRGVANAVSNGGTGNDFSGLKGCSGRGRHSATTDSNGRTTITLPTVPTGMTIAPMVSLISTSLVDCRAHVRSASISPSSEIVVEVRKDDGTAVASTAVVIGYLYECY